MGWIFIRNEIRWEGISLQHGDAVKGVNLFLAATVISTLNQQRLSFISKDGELKRKPQNAFI